MGRRRQRDHRYAPIPLALHLVPDGIETFFSSDMLTPGPHSPTDPLAIPGLAAVRMHSTRLRIGQLAGELYVATQVAELAFPFTIAEAGPGQPYVMWLGDDEQSAVQLFLPRNANRRDQDCVVGVGAGTLIAGRIAYQHRIRPGPTGVYYRDVGGVRTVTSAAFVLAVRAGLMNFSQADRQLHPASDLLFAREERLILDVLGARDPANSAALLAAVPHFVASLRRATRLPRPRGMRPVGLAYSGAQVIPPKLVSGIAPAGGAAAGGLFVPASQNLGQMWRLGGVTPISMASSGGYQVSTRNAAAGVENAFTTPPRLALQPSGRSFFRWKAALGLASGVVRAGSAQLAAGPTPAETSFGRTFAAETGTAHTFREAYLARTISTSLHHTARLNEVNRRTLEVLERGEPADALHRLEIRLQHLLTAASELLPEILPGLSQEQRREIDRLLNDFDTTFAQRAVHHSALDDHGAEPAAAETTQRWMTMQQIVTTRLVPDWVAAAGMLPILYATGHMELLTLFFARVVYDSALYLRSHKLEDLTKPDVNRRLRDRMEKEHAFTDELHEHVAALADGRATEPAPAGPAGPASPAITPFAKNAWFEFLMSQLAAGGTLLTDETRPFWVGMAFMYGLRPVQDGADRLLAGRSGERHQVWQSNERRLLGGRLLARQLRQLVAELPEAERAAVLVDALGDQVAALLADNDEWEEQVRDDRLRFGETAAELAGDEVLRKIWDAVRPDRAASLSVGQPARYLDVCAYECAYDPMQLRQLLGDVVAAVRERHGKETGVDYQRLAASLAATEIDDELAKQWGTVVKYHVHSQATDVALGELALAGLREFGPPELRSWRRVGTGDGSVTDAGASEMAAVLVRLHELDGVGRVGGAILAAWLEAVNPAHREPVHDGVLMLPHVPGVALLHEMATTAEDDLAQIPVSHPVFAPDGLRERRIVRRLPTAKGAALRLERRRLDRIATTLRSEQEADWPIGESAGDGLSRYRAWVRQQRPAARQRPTPSKPPR